MFLALLDRLSSWSVPHHLNEGERRITRAMSGMIILIWFSGLAIHMGSEIFFPGYNPGFWHHLGTFTFGSLYCLSLNANGWYRSALFHYIALLFVLLFIPSWTVGRDMDFIYLRYNVACFLSLLVAHVTFVFVKGRSLLLVLYTVLIMLLFVSDSLLIPLLLKKAPAIELQTYLSFKFLFIFLMIALVVYTQLVRSTLKLVDRRQDEIEERIKRWEVYADEKARHRR